VEAHKQEVHKDDSDEEEEESDDGYGFDDVEN
jgi:hypothetical protein